MSAPKTIAIKSTCCYCGTGCGVIIESDGKQITSVRGDPDHPANFGKLCTKGTTLALTASDTASVGRARFPELRRDRRNPRQRSTWEDANALIADKIVQVVKDHGADAIGVYVSGQLLTEDYYAFNKFVKGVLGTNNIDTNSRLCMSSAVTGYTQTLGVDAPPCSYEDLDDATCLFVAGSNTAFAHPILFRRIEAAKAANPDLKIIVVDPRKTETAAFADLHLPILPGTDVALFQAMLHVMLWEEWVDRDYLAAHVEGLPELRSAVREMSPAVAAEICGVPAEDIIKATKWFAQSKATLSLYCQGLNQSSSGTAKNATLINMHLLTAQIGRPGAGPFSLTGQPNAMGGREVGGLATSLAAHRDYANPTHREEVRAFWNAPHISATRGKTAVEMFAAAKRGEIKVLWIVCTNPAQSLPDLSEVDAALQTAELVIVQDAYANTETAAYADVLLPATSWGEKDGTVTNSERRISRVRSAAPARGEAKHDWQIVCEIGARVQTQLAPGSPPMLDFQTPEALWNEHRELTRGRDLDITGLSYAMLERDGPQQWPLREGDVAGAKRLYTDGVFQTANGKAKLFVAPYRSVADKVDAHYPFSLTTGRLRDQWHGMSRTGSVARLYGHTPEPRLAMNPHDLARRNLRAGELLKVSSRRGSLYVRAEASESMRSGQVYLPMHWGKNFLGGSASFGVNTLTNPTFDPFSRQPELKHSAVKVASATFAWHLSAFRFCDEPSALLTRLSALQSEVAFMSVGLIGRDKPGVFVRVSNENAPNTSWINAFDDLLDLQRVDVLRYDDPRRASTRRVLVSEDQLVALRVSGDEVAIQSAEWLRDWALAAKAVTPIRRLLLSPLAQAPVGTVATGKTVCDCFGISTHQIESVLSASAGDGAQRLAALQAAHGCGTNCGSCLPELRRLVASTPCIADVTLATSQPQAAAA